MAMRTIFLPEVLGVLSQIDHFYMHTQYLGISLVDPKTIHLQRVPNS